MDLTLPTELFIDGAFVAGEGEPERVLNPATGALLVEVPEASTEQVRYGFFNMSMLLM